MNKLTLILLLVFFSIRSISQDSIQKKFEWGGYLKDMQSIVFTNDFKNADYTNLVHNRLNFRWKPTKKITGAFEIRNRFYWGSDATDIIATNQPLRGENEKIDLSANWYSDSNIILVSTVERFWLEYKSPKWEARAGRQRLNWGMASIWNPNDIFNTYNFLDFDYEERPGCDAIKAKYLINNMSNIEVAVSSANENKMIAAAKYSFNKGGYDFQLLSGFYKTSFTSGFGWAGNIGNWGYKGEGQVFLNEQDSLNFFNITMEFDYIFKNGWYINTSCLFNNKGLNSPLTNWSDISFKISPTSLMPAKWNLLVNTSKEFTPLFSGSMVVEYSPGINMLILYPSFKYNFTSNLDLDLVWQSLFSEVSSFRGIVHAGFFRIKWSF